MGKVPYITHVTEVASILSTMTDDQEIMAAGALHDVVEDAGVLPEELTEIFGERIAGLVASETENKRSNERPEDTWQIRKEESLAELKASEDTAVKMLWLTDKLSNIRSMERSYETMGEDLWQHFHQHDPKMHKWYYEGVADAVAELSDTAAYREYIRLQPTRNISKSSAGKSMRKGWLR